MDLAAGAHLRPGVPHPPAHGDPPPDPADEGRREPGRAVARAAPDAGAGAQRRRPRGHGQRLQGAARVHGRDGHVPDEALRPDGVPQEEAAAHGGAAPAVKEGREVVDGAVRLPAPAGVVCPLHREVRPYASARAARPADRRRADRPPRPFVSPCFILSQW